LTGTHPFFARPQTAHTTYCRGGEDLGGLVCGFGFALPPVPPPMPGLAIGEIVAIGEAVIPGDPVVPGDAEVPAPPIEPAPPGEAEELGLDEVVPLL